MSIVFFLFLFFFLNAYFFVGNGGMGRGFIWSSFLNVFSLSFFLFIFIDPCIYWLLRFCKYKQI